MFVRKREGRPARVGGLAPEIVQAWMDHMAETDLALSTMRSRQSTLSSFCTWLVKRESLTENPAAKLDRPRIVPNGAAGPAGGRARPAPLPPGPLRGGWRRALPPPRRAPLRPRLLSHCSRRA